MFCSCKCSLQWSLKTLYCCNFFLCCCHFEVLFLQADSGGPLMVGDEGLITVVGVISTGIGCAQPKLPGLYTRLSSYSTWIRTHIQAPWRHLNMWIVWQRMLHKTVEFNVWNATSLREWGKEGNAIGEMMLQISDTTLNCWVQEKWFTSWLILITTEDVTRVSELAFFHHYVKEHVMRFICRNFARRRDTN
jgi:hypothetical protein